MGTWIGQIMQSFPKGGCSLPDFSLISEWGLLINRDESWMKYSLQTATFVNLVSLLKWGQLWRWPYAIWVVEAEAAQVVRELYRLFLKGLGKKQIANVLTERGVETPIIYFQRCGMLARSKSEIPHIWNMATAAIILKQEDYTGCTVNFKTKKKSYKSKAQERTTHEHWCIFENTQEAINDRETFETVRKMFESRRSPKKIGAPCINIFNGLVYCADCGNRMYLHHNCRQTQCDAFACSKYKRE